MANVLIEESILQGWANTIREKNGVTDKMKPSVLLEKTKELDVGGGSSDLVKYVTFMSEDGSTELFKMPVLSGDDCKDPITHGDIETPTKESTNTQNFTYSGWASTSGGSASNSALKNITSDKIVYASYTASVRYYTVRIYDEDTTTLLQTIEVTYGANAEEYVDIEKTGYKISGYSVDITNVTSNVDTIVMWVIDDGVIRDDWATIASNPSAYKVGNKKEITLTYSDGTTETGYAILVDKGVNPLSDGTGFANLTFVVDFIVKTSTKVGTARDDSVFHRNTTIKTFLDTTLFNALPSELSGVIKQITDDKSMKWAKYNLFVPSCMQLTGKETPYAISYSFYQPQPLKQFEYFANGGGYNFTKLNDSTADDYWLSTEHATSTYSSTFKCFYRDGNTYNSDYANGTARGVVFGFCI